MSTEERIDGLTPAGGTYSITYFQDDSGNPIDKAKASKAEIVEFNERGESIFRTYGYFEPSPAK
jgi:hypothetical protein